MGHHNAFSNNRKMVSILPKDDNVRGLAVNDPNFQHMNKPYRISPSFINLVVKNQPRSHGSLLPVPMDRRENLGTRLVKNKEEGD